MPADGTRPPPHQRGFAPVIDAGVRVLVLGSFPSEASLAAGQYYGHPRNQFWPILGDVLGEPLAQLPYGDRLLRALARGIGIWDVVAACRRAGSLDSAIRTPQWNDLERLPQLAPALQAVAFNGQAAGRLKAGVVRMGYVCEVLPSTSPAHAARNYRQKLELWRNFLQAWCTERLGLS